MRIDKRKARIVLEEQVHEARLIHVAGPWVDRILALSKECESGHQTLIAAYGTALLAKAVEVDVDVFSLQVGENRGGNTYSARALCKDVLAAEATRLGINLGVTGPEPMNNNQFNGKPRITRELNVRSDGKRALGLLCDALEALQEVRTQKEALAALRAFLSVRVRTVSRIVVEQAEGDELAETDLVRLIQGFVAEDSEGGKRAQAVAAGLLETMVGEDLIKTQRINDPSRRMPGDIGIYQKTGQKKFERVFEVRDKPISSQDIDKLIDKIGSAGLTKVGMLAVSNQQGDLDLQSVTARAEARSIRLCVYLGWPDFVKETLYWSHADGPSVGLAFRTIFKNLVQHEVSEVGQRAWTAKEALG